MRPLSAQEMLAAWERGLEQIPLERALTLLTAACPEIDPQRLAVMSIGRRDAWLLTLREWAFGPRMTGCTVCHRCSQMLEIDMQVSDLRQTAGDTEPGAITLSLGGYELSLRPLNSLDLAACSGASPHEIARQLFGRCVIAALSEEGAMLQDRVPDDVVRIAMENVAHADPQADLEIIVSCATCGQSTKEPFDIVSFFWSEIDSWARRILREVHKLASAYGWREADILALSALRRQFYLEMAGS